MIGSPLPDLRRAPRARDISVLTIWATVLCERPDGSRYALHVYYFSEGTAEGQRVEVQGGVESLDGGKEHFSSVAPRLEFEPRNRRLRERPDHRHRRTPGYEPDLRRLVPLTMTTLRR
ncbi:MAG: hypothetical protein ACYDB7_10800 [Mycobacteriales bacterium]